MKKLCLLLAISTITFVACKNTSSEKTAPATEQKATTDKYQCPMKCENKFYEKAGKCPVCEMELEKVAEG